MEFTNQQPAVDNSLESQNIISKLSEYSLDHVVEKILTNLDIKSLGTSLLVCKTWYTLISNNRIWKKILEKKVRDSSFWHGLAIRRGWIGFFNDSITRRPPYSFYQQLFSSAMDDTIKLKENWKNGYFIVNSVETNSRTVSCIQSDDEKIITGHKSNNVHVWDKNTLRCLHVLTGHTLPVVLLQFDENILISGSFDCTFIVWDIKTYNMLNQLRYKNLPVASLAFYKNILVTGFWTRTVIVWNINSPTDITFRADISMHQECTITAAVNSRYIVLGNLNSVISVWNSQSLELEFELKGHIKPISCVKMYQTWILSSSWDGYIKIWDINTKQQLRTLTLSESIMSVSLNEQNILCNDYSGRIHLWDLQTVWNSSIHIVPMSQYVIDLRQWGNISVLTADDFEFIACMNSDIIIVGSFLQKEWKLPSFIPLAPLEN